MQILKWQFESAPNLLKNGKQKKLEFLFCFLPWFLKSRSLVFKNQEKKKLEKNRIFALVIFLNSSMPLNFEFNNLVQSLLFFLRKPLFSVLFSFYEKKEEKGQTRGSRVTHRNWKIKKGRNKILEFLFHDFFSQCFRIPITWFMPMRVFWEIFISFFILDLERNCLKIETRNMVKSGLSCKWKRKKDSV